MHLTADDLTKSGIGRSVAIFAGGSLLLICGIVGLGLLAPGEGVVPDEMKRISPFVLATIGLALMAVEAAVFTLLRAELSRRFFKSVWPGLALGGGAYIVGVHWDNGWLGLATSAWIWMVVTTAYLLDRPRSLFRASVQAVGLKWVFWSFALTSLVSAA
ncbi:hypothetical protein [Brevundimonas sp. 'scallop']|uniref:hypothetical protein n=1 Tax=Brevundimonas sp. 'scallop' TaxID=2562582 RepID=UPI0013E1D46C|nr:hypothetical protein [Brevundimonas sp. 'scallop']QIF82152.1 hypothetical protein E4341_10810 [Brevundimonas sp. 'scallop']